MTGEYRGPLQLVIFDWAGTTVDHGCFAPVVPFQELFRARGVDLTVAEAREPMGLGKRDHIAALLEMPEVAARWKVAQGKLPTAAELDRMFAEEFMPRQLESVADCCELVPGMLSCVAALRQRGLRIGATTGYFREAEEMVVAAAKRQGYEPDAHYSASDVPAGRPAPWMVYRNMQTLGVFPPAAVVKVGDTVPDIEEGRNAGVWSLGVAATGSDVGLSAPQLASLVPADLNVRLGAARQKLQAAGAHYVINSVADLPDLLPEIERRVAAGERP
ncbi:MAG: phosphonoacetaldehyde hydrolase [Planctomycetaceae bacterium]|nr:phosphonoacetaldehyde hydrolase [Planctomycetaceae bacterium]